MGTGIGRPEPTPAFGGTPSSQSVPTLVSEEPGPPRSPDDPTRPPRREAPAPVVLPLSAAAENESLAPSQPLGERETQLQLSLAEEPTRLKFVGEEPAPVAADDAEALAFPRRSPAKLVALGVGALGLLLAVGFLGVRLFAGESSKPAAAHDAPAVPDVAAGVVAPAVPVPALPDAGAAGAAGAGAAAAAGGAGGVEPAPTAKALVPADAGAVTVRILPYGALELDGEDLGMSPFDEPLAVKAGAHTIVVRNPDNGKSEKRSLAVVAGEPLELNFDLR